MAALPEAPAVDPAKRESEELLDQTLRLQARLENGGVREWGEDRLKTSYPDVLHEIDGANAAFDRRRFAEAATRFRTSISGLRQLEASRAERLERALQSGQAALERADPPTAQRQFKLALAIEPEQPKAKLGLSRAMSLRRVVDLTAAADALVGRKELDAAKRSYEEAVGIDPAFAPARDGLDRVERTILSRDFDRAISTALAALDQRAFSKADGALSKAKQLRPEAPEIKDIQQRMTIVRRTVALERLRESARRSEKAENWEKALGAYDAALKIDATTAFAVRGKAEAQKYLDLYRKIDFYLARPGRLQSAAPRAYAKRLLSVAASIARPGPVLAGKRDRLRELIATAERPVAVTLRSDGKTEITVYRVGRFGAFSERRLELPPGSYTAVGNRPGYRDVRVVFRVPAADGNAVVVVVCKEPI